MNLKPRDVVRVYVDPKVQQIPEGDAELLQKHNTTGDGGEYWTVRFMGERETHGRWIYPPAKECVDC